MVEEIEEKKENRGGHRHGAKYSIDLAERICVDFATHTMAAIKILDLSPDYPDYTTLCRWRFRHPEFDAMFTRAIQFQVRLEAEEMKQIADDESDYVYYEDKDGVKRLDSRATFERKKIRIDVRKFNATKLARKFYGDSKESDVEPAKQPIDVNIYLSDLKKES